MCDSSDYKLTSFRVENANYIFKWLESRENINCLGHLYKILRFLNKFIKVNRVKYDGEQHFKLS